MGRGAVALAVTAILGVAATACDGATRDKAGDRTSNGNPRVLRIAVHDPGWSATEFAAAVAERSSGSLEIRPETTPRMDTVDWERRTVADVRAGRVDLAVVGARVWDTFGVTSFQALLAPFLVTDLELERRALESSYAVPLLSAVEQGGVVGIALLPGPLRRPFGHSQPLVRPEDYTGRTVGVAPGEVEEATFRALGARPRAYESLHPSFFAGAALDAGSIVEGGYEGETLAANVVLWPRPETIVMNRQAFEALTRSQRTVLLEAGRAAVGPRTRDLARSEGEAVRAICTRSLPALVTVPPRELARLGRAVRPVYAHLERRPAARRMLAEIRTLRTRVRAEPLRCPAAKTTVASELEARWRATPNRAAFRAGGVPPELGGLELELENGQWYAHGLSGRREWTGTYAVSGDVVRFVIETCSHNPCTPGAATEYRWSVYRDTLSLEPLPGRSSWPLLSAEPFSRID